MLIKEKCYVALCSLFSVLIVTSNLVYQKFVQINILSFFSFELSVAVTFYPIAFLLTDLIAEFYGKAHAKFCIRIAISCSIIVACLIATLNKLEATDWSKIDNETFNNVFGLYGVGFIGSIVAGYIAQIVDINIFLFIKKITKGKILWLRSNLSTSVSLLVDTSIVISTLSFFGALPTSQIIPLIFSSYAFKVIITIALTPVFYLAVYTIKAITNGKQDIYKSSKL